MNTPTKLCCKCHEEFPATTEFFAEDRRRKSGLQSQCRGCQRSRAKQWAQDNKERNRSRANEWARINKEQKQANNRAYQERHPLRYQEMMRMSRIKHKDSRANYNRDWRTRNRELTRSYWRNYMARKRNAIGKHTAQDILAQLKRQKQHCYYCGASVGAQYHVDHVVPISRGGSNDPSNLVITCPHCNESKNDRLPNEWPQGGRLL